MTVKEKLENFETMPCTVKKISSKNPEEADLSLETKFSSNFRPVNALSTVSLKLICSKFPRWHFLKMEIITRWTALKYIPKKKFRCFDLEPDGPFSAV